MLLDFALTELLLAKDYTPQSDQRREYALRGLIRQAGGAGISEIEGVTTGTVRATWPTCAEGVAWMRATG